MDQVQFTLIDELPADAAIGVRRSKFAEALTAAKQHPGRWVHVGRHNYGATVSIRKKGFEVAIRSRVQRPGVKTIDVDIYLRWPSTGRRTETTPTPPVAKPPAKPGERKVVVCSSCEFEAAADDVSKLIRHCADTHGRRATRDERTPVAA